MYKSIFFLFFLKTLFAAHSWTSPVTLYSQLGNSAMNPQLSISNTGEMAAIWIVDSSGTFEVHASRVVGSSWTQSSLLGSMQNTPTVLTEIITDNYVVAVWDQVDGSGYHLMSSSCHQGSWSNSASLTTLSQTPYSLMPTLTTNYAGWALLNWKSSDNQLMGSTYNTITNLWTTPFSISEASLSLLSGIFMPTVLFQDGTAKTILYGTEAIFQSDFNANDPTNPTNDQILPFVASSSVSPAVASLPQDDKAAFIYEELHRNYLIAGINYKEAEEVTSWYTTLIAKTAQSNTAVSIGVDIEPTSKKLAAIWQTEQNQIYFSTFNKVQWKLPVTLSKNGKSPVVKFNPVNGHAVCLWAEDSVLVSEWDGTNWSTPISISNTSSLIGGVQLGFDSAGNGVALWHRQIGPDLVIEGAFTQ